MSIIFPIILEGSMGILVPGKKDHTAINSFPQSIFDNLYL